MSWAETAAFVASVATTVAAVAVVVTARIYYAQLRAMTQARELESLLAIMDYVDRLDLRKARYLFLEYGSELRALFDVPFSWDSRRKINQRIAELSGGELTIHNIDLTLNALNNVSYLVRNGYAPADTAEAFMKNSLLHAWYAFEPYIQHRRARPDTIGEPSRYAEHFEWIVVHKYGREPLANQPLRPTSGPNASPRTEGPSEAARG